MIATPPKFIPPFLYNGSLPHGMQSNDIPMAPGPRELLPLLSTSNPLMIELNVRFPQVDASQRPPYA